jgi:hypothetical protein
VRSNTTLRDLASAYATATSAGVSSEKVIVSLGDADHRVTFTDTPAVLCRLFDEVVAQLDTIAASS